MDKEIKKIKLGEVFQVDNKLYLIQVPTTPTEDLNDHGHIVFTLVRM